MNLSCNVTQDLLPLYADGVCCEESGRAVEAHLAECETCREALAAMKRADREAEAECAVTEERKAASLRRVKKKLLWRQALTVCAVLILLAGVGFATVRGLKGTVEEVVCDGNLSVSMVDGDLMGRLRGSRECRVRIKRVTVTEEGTEKNYLFFSLSETKWDALTTHSEVFSEYVLCPAEKGAEELDGVYYRAGDDTDLENMTAAELAEVKEQSVLLWSRG